MVRIKNKQELKEVLFSEGYDVILFWRNGEWDYVSSGYAGEMDGEEPSIILARSGFYDQTKKAIEEKIREIEGEI